MPRVVIVDGFFSGKHLAQYLRDAGCELVHVASRPDHAPNYYRGFKHNIYTVMMVNTNPDLTLALLETFKPDYILAGCEAGVALADILNEHLSLPYANKFNTTDCRRNKFKKINKLHEEKIPAAEQIKIQNWSDLESWLTKRQCPPVVLQPLDSADSDGVFVCRDLDSCHRAFDLISDKVNKMNSTNDFVLAQEFLDGTEYVVNTVSLDGETLLTELVEYKNQILPTGNVVYDVDRLLPSDHKVANELFSYVKEVHRALGIRNGAAHAKVMLTKTGPKLVEIATRPDSSLRPDLCEKTTQLGQLKAFALSITNPQAFFELCKKGSYQLAAYSLNVWFISPPAQSKSFSSKIMEDLQRMPSFFDASFYVDEDSLTQKTQAVCSQRGTVYLVHENLEVLKNDLVKIRQLEKEIIYFSLFNVSKISETSIKQPEEVKQVQVFGNSPMEFFPPSKSNSLEYPKELMETLMTAKNAYIPRDDQLVYFKVAIRLDIMAIEELKNEVAIEIYAEKLVNSALLHAAGDGQIQCVEYLVQEHKKYINVEGIQDAIVYAKAIAGGPSYDAVINYLEQSLPTALDMSA